MFKQITSTDGHLFLSEPLMIINSEQALLNIPFD